MPPHPNADPLADVADLLSSFGAGVLAAAISEHWRLRGYPGVKAERYELPGGGGWGVRSNLLNGLPRMEAGK
jgi:hypothetical protein